MYKSKISSRQRRKLRCRLYQEQEGRCFHCERPTTLDPEHVNRVDAATLDHIWPRGKGGGNRVWNFVMACRGCNFERGNMAFDLFYALKETSRKVWEAAR